MRRIAPILALAALSACDPTGNVVTFDSSHVRFAPFVYDVGAGLNVTTDGVAVASGLTYGNLSSYKDLGIDTSVFTVTRSTDAFLLGSDTLDAAVDVKYTMYMLGTISGFRSLIVTDDTVLATAGKVKLRFVHGVRTDSLLGFDLYITTPG